MYTLLEALGNELGVPSKIVRAALAPLQPSSVSKPVRLPKRKRLQLKPKRVQKEYYVEPGVTYIPPDYQTKD
jgi:hypothetical protein